jgi:glycosyltransferase involved in cell wall biosynthesis
MTVVPALPVACPCAQGDAQRRPRVVFLGAFAARKGFPLLAEAWPLVLADQPDAELVVVGKGELEPLAHELGALSSVRVVVDPPRDAIHEELRQARVLALPSQRAGRWREQVGLPIVEGLAHGCTVVTTDETGLADWLVETGHRVLHAPTSVEDLAGSIAAALRENRSAADVSATLPLTDGRLEADAWMFSAPSPAVS